MMDLGDPTWWAMIAGQVVTILAGFGVVGGIPDAVRAALVAVGPVVGAVYVHERHATARNRDTAAAAAGTASAHAQAAIATANAQVQTAQITAGHPPAAAVPPTAA